MWENICESLKTVDGQKPVSSNIARSKLNQVQKLLNAKGSLTPTEAQLPSVEKSNQKLPDVVTKHDGPSGIGIFTGGPGNREKKRRTGSSKTPKEIPEPSMTYGQVIENLSITGSSQFLDLFDKKPIVVRPGILAPPCIPTMSEMVSLLDGSWVTDRIIDSYLGLACQFGNGDFAVQDLMAPRSGSPKWHAWTAWLPTGLQNGQELKREWPPNAYPLAKIEDVEHHVFPILIDNNHWVMAILSRVSSG